MTTVQTIADKTQKRRVIVFRRDDGSFGFEEYRRDHEDLRGWFSLRRYGTQVFASESDALQQAKTVVDWLVDAIHLKQ